MRKATLFLLAVVFSCGGYASVASAKMAPETVFPPPPKDAGDVSVSVPNPVVVPGDALYFLKKVSREFERAFTFRAAERAAAEADILNRIAAEIKVLAARVAERPAKQAALISALRNYEENLGRLEKRFFELQAQGVNENSERILERLVGTLRSHRLLFVDIIARGSAAVTQGAGRANEALTRTAGRILEAFGKEGGIERIATETNERRVEEFIRMLEQASGRTLKRVTDSSQLQELLMQKFGEAQQKAKEDAAKGAVPREEGSEERYPKTFFDSSKPVSVFSFDARAREEQRRWYGKDFAVDHNAIVSQFNTQTAEQASCRCLGKVTCDGKDITGVRKSGQSEFYECRRFDCALGLTECRKYVIPPPPGR